MPALRQQLDDIIQDMPQYNLYCIIDAAQASKLDINWKDNFYKDGSPFYILGDTTEIPTHCAILPWLAQIIPNGAVHSFLLKHAGKSIGLLFTAGPELGHIAQALLPLRHVVLPDGSIAWFRFYDPRVFTVFFSRADANQKYRFFSNSINTYFAEDIISEKIISYSDFKNNKIDNYASIMHITQAQKEHFDEAHFNNIIYLIFNDIIKYKKYKNKKYSDLYNDIFSLAEWGYDLGVTDAHELHILTRTLLKMSWDNQLAAFLKKKTILFPEPNPVARRKYICAQRLRLWRQS